MDKDEVVIDLIQKVAALEVKVSTCVDNVNGFGEVIRKDIKDSKESISKLETRVLTAQIYILACVSVMGLVAGVVGFIVSAYGIRLEDIFMASKK